jgi:hypothetical protein
MVVCGQLQGKHVRFYYHSFAFCNLSFIVYYDFVAREKTLIKHLCSIGPITITKKKKKSDKTPATVIYWSLDSSLPNRSKSSGILMMTMMAFLVDKQMLVSWG